MPDLMSALVAVVGPDHVVTGTALASRATSWIDPAPLQGLALVRPHTTAEVAAVLALCHAARQRVITYGGGKTLRDGLGLVAGWFGYQGFDSHDSSRRPR